MHNTAYQFTDGSLPYYTTVRIDMYDIKIFIFSLLSLIYHWILIINFAIYTKQFTGPLRQCFISLYLPNCQDVTYIYVLVYWVRISGGG